MPSKNKQQKKPTKNCFSETFFLHERNFKKVSSSPLDRYFKFPNRFDQTKTRWTWTDPTMTKNPYREEEVWSKKNKGSEEEDGRDLIPDYLLLQLQFSS